MLIKIAPHKQTGKKIQIHRLWFLTFMVSRRSTYTVSVFSTSLISSFFNAARSRMRSRSVTLLHPSVSPASFSRTVMVVVSTIVSCTATISCSILMLSLFSFVRLFTSYLTMPLLLPHPLAHRTLTAKRTFINPFHCILQLLHLLS